MQVIFLIHFVELELSDYREKFLHSEFLQYTFRLSSTLCKSIGLLQNIQFMRKLKELEVYLRHWLGSGLGIYREGL